MLEDVVKSMLPQGLLDHFKMIKFMDRICEEAGEIFYELYLEENNILPLDYSSSQYESKG